MDYKFINEVLATEDQEEIDNVLAPYPDDGTRYTHNKHAYRLLEDARTDGFFELLRESTKPMRLCTVGAKALAEQFKIKKDK